MDVARAGRGLTIDIPMPIRTASDTAPSSRLDPTVNTQTLAQLYLRDRRRADRIGEGTLKCYRNTLGLFARSVPEDPTKITRRHVQAFIDRPGIRASTRRMRLSRVRGLFHWAVLHGHVRRDPTVGVEPPTEPARLPRNLTIDEARAVITAATTPRSRLVALLMLQEGLRCVEVARAQVGDVDLHRRVLAVRGKGGRGDITRRLPLSDETVAALTVYWGDDPILAGALIRNQTEPTIGVTSHHIGTIIRQAMVEAGVKKAAYDGRSAHALRHTCLQDIVDSGANIRVAQKFAGHAHVSTTETYLRGHVEGIRQAVSGRRYAS